MPRKTTRRAVAPDYRDIARDLFEVLEARYNEADAVLAQHRLALGFEASNPAPAETAAELARDHKKVARCLFRELELLAWQLDRLAVIDDEIPPSIRLELLEEDLLHARDRVTKTLMRNRSAGALEEDLPGWSGDDDDEERTLASLGCESGGETQHEDGRS